jgi:hypothetical protein
MQNSTQTQGVLFHEAVRVVTNAIHADEAGRWEEAIRLYEQALGDFEHAFSAPRGDNDGDLDVETCRQTCAGYERRLQEIRQDLMSSSPPQHGTTTGNPTVNKETTPPQVAAVSQTGSGSSYYMEQLKHPNDLMRQALLAEKERDFVTAYDLYYESINEFDHILKDCMNPRLNHFMNEKIEEMHTRMGELEVTLRDMGNEDSDGLHDETEIETGHNHSYGQNFDADFTEYTDHNRNENAHVHSRFDIDFAEDGNGREPLPDGDPNEVDFFNNDNLKPTQPTVTSRPIMFGRDDQTPAKNQLEGIYKNSMENLEEVIEQRRREAQALKNARLGHDTPASIGASSVASSAESVRVTDVLRSFDAVRASGRSTGSSKSQASTARTPAPGGVPEALVFTPNEVPPSSSEDNTLAQEWYREREFMLQEKTRLEMIINEMERSNAEVESEAQAARDAAKNSGQYSEMLAKESSERMRLETRLESMQVELNEAMRLLDQKSISINEMEERLRSAANTNSNCSDPVTKEDLYVEMKKMLKKARELDASDSELQKLLGPPSLPMEKVVSGSGRPLDPSIPTSVPIHQLNPAKTPPPEKRRSILNLVLLAILQLTILAVILMYIDEHVPIGESPFGALDEYRVTN